VFSSLYAFSAAADAQACQCPPLAGFCVMMRHYNFILIERTKSILAGSKDWLLLLPNEEFTKSAKKKPGKRELHPIGRTVQRSKIKTPRQDFTPAGALFFTVLYFIQIHPKQKIHSSQFRKFDSHVVCLPHSLIYVLAGGGSSGGTGDGSVGSPMNQ